MAPKIAVIGAGITGLSTAFVTKRDNPNFDVLLISDEFSPNVTSDGAPGYFYPNGYEKCESYKKFTLATLKWLKDSLKHPESYKHGISTCTGFYIADYIMEVPKFANVFSDFRVLSDEDLKEFPSFVKSGFSFTTFVCEGSKYLPFLLKRFTEFGGRVVKKKINSFDELQDYDVIVNCSGLGSAVLCNDKEVAPMRGQIIRVKAPWIRHFYKLRLSSPPNTVYVYPNCDFTVLGGTSQMGNYSRSISYDDKKMIYEKTTELVSSLKDAEEICDWVGLRPYRPEIRLEKEFILCSNKRPLKVVHNYGHGRNGISYHYGCAVAAAEIVRELVDVTVKDTSLQPSKEAADSDVLRQQSKL